jgi:hypothetical protein
MACLTYFFRSSLEAAIVRSMSSQAERAINLLIPAITGICSRQSVLITC